MGGKLGVKFGVVRAEAEDDASTARWVWIGREVGSDYLSVCALVKTRHQQLQELKSSLAGTHERARPGR